MELELASPNEKEKMQMRQYQAQPAPLAEQKPGFVEEFGNMAKKRAMEGALNKGQNFLTEGGAKPYMQGITNAINPMGSAGAGAVAGQAATNAAMSSTPALMGMGGAQLGAGAATGAAGMGGMAALGTAVPYVGAGLLAGKALGLFNEGGQVGPLSTQYKAGGGYSIPNPMISEYDVLDAYDRYLKKLPSPDDYTLSNLALGYQDFKDSYMDNNAIKFNQGGQVPINDNDEINKILDEIEAEEASQMVEGAIDTSIPMPMMRPPLTTAPLGNDTTYSDEMYKSINT